MKAGNPPAAKDRFRPLPSLHHEHPHTTSPFRLKLETASLSLANNLSLLADSLMVNPNIADVSLDFEKSASILRNRPQQDRCRPRFLKIDEHIAPVPG